ncbi:MAG TPA: glycoside hydrolase family 36 N-terminal domain-containing protein, partial [Acetobacteraceae bacterium]|nr:glycoside hydrolase family 36 N-terminal domain-containing protein [Acetobacteraceae bacterium]
MPRIIHWGARLPERVAATELLGWLGATQDGPSLFPTIGNDFLRTPALEAHRRDRDWTAGFRVTDLRAGDGLLRIVAADPVAALELELRLVLGCEDVLTMSARLRNAGTADLEVGHLAAGVFLLPQSAGSVLLSDGRW